jgi:hypothetical protein
MVNIFFYVLVMNHTKFGMHGTSGGKTPERSAA